MAKKNCPMLASKRALKMRARYMRKLDDGRTGKAYGLGSRHSHIDKEPRSVTVQTTRSSYKLGRLRTMMSASLWTQPKRPKPVGS